MEKTRKQYKIVSANDVGKLERLVNTYLRAGWQLEGGVCTLFGTLFTGFYQAMSYENKANELPPELPPDIPGNGS